MDETKKWETATDDFNSPAENGQDSRIAIAQQPPVSQAQPPRPTMGFGGDSSTRQYPGYISSTAQEDEGFGYDFEQKLKEKYLGTETLSASYAEAEHKQATMGYKERYLEGCTRSKTEEEAERLWARLVDPRSKDERPMVFATRKDPGIFIYEYTDRLQFYRKTDEGMILLATEYKDEAVSVKQK